MQYKIIFLKKKMNRICIKRVYNILGNFDIEYLSIVKLLDFKVKNRFLRYQVEKIKYL